MKPILLPGAVLIFACAALSLAWSQQKPLQRNFSANSVAQYRIRLAVQSELKGQQTIPRSGAVYVQEFARVGEGHLEWLVTQCVASTAADRSAAMEETLDDSGPPATTLEAQDPESQKLTTSILDSLTRWREAAPRTLHYRQLPDGELAGLDAAGAPNLAEAAPSLLTLWLQRALRPTASLPGRAVRVGERWQEPRAVKLDSWNDVNAWESGQWFEPLRPSEPAVRLLVIQQILGRVTAGPEKPPEGSAQGSFHGESLATVALDDGRLLAASRSASREISWKLAAVPGLSEPPEFRARLSVEVEIASADHRE